MKMDVTETTLVLLFLTIVGTAGKDFARVCYLTRWSLSRQNEAIRYSFDDMDSSLCTHFVYAFADLDETTLELLPLAGDDTFQGILGNYAKFNKIKQNSPGITTLLSVGGQDAAVTATFVKLTQNTATITNFARKAAAFLRFRQFDGLDIDWEFPDHPEGANRQFSALLKIVYEEFVKEAKNSNKKQLLLTIAVSPGEDRIKKAYEIDVISRYVDYIFIMAYDFFGSWSTLTGFNSPLYNRSSDPRFSLLYNVDHAVKVWLKGGAPRSKLVVGQTGAGSSFTVNAAGSHEVGVPVTGKGKPGDLFGEQSRLIYPEICRNIDAGWKRVFDQEQKVPYAYKADQWVGYDDTESFGYKADYVAENQLGGIMFWELAFDDFTGRFCHKGKYPLLNTIKKKLALGSSKSTSTIDPNFKLIVSGKCAKLISHSAVFLVVIITLVL